MKNISQKSKTIPEHAHYFALVSGHIIALSVAIVFGLTIYAETDPVFKRSMAFMFMPIVGDVQTQVASVITSLNK